MLEKSERENLLMGHWKEIDRGEEYGVLAHTDAYKTDR